MKILMLAPKCFPVNGAEAIVNIKLLSAMTQDGGFEVDLITRKNAKVMYPSESLDAYGVRLNALYMIENEGGFSLKVLWQSLKALLIFKSVLPGCHWAVRALPIVKKLIKENDYDFVLTKNSPSFMLGAYLKKKGFRWVASWNDPFPASFYPSPYGQGNKHKPSLLDALMIRQMKKADYHVFPTLRLQQHMAAYLPFPENRARVIPHVVLTDVAPTWRGCAISETLRIVHSGNLGEARDPRTFFMAIENVMAKHKEVNLEITILGNIDKADIPTKENYPHLVEHFNLIPPVEYSKALDLLKDYSVACIIEAPCKAGEAVFLPTKVTDFMQVGIPVLTISPKEGVLHDLYKRGCIGYFGDVHDVADIQQTLMMLWRDFKNGTIKQNVIDNSFKPQAVADSYRDILKDLSRC